jgi:hypothetical protein
MQQILSVYALAEDPRPQNHHTKKKKNQHSPVPGPHSAKLATLFTLLFLAAALLATLSLSASSEFSDSDD